VRILLTNDDGIDSPGILITAEALRKAGHRVFVLAPDINRSGVSHGISFLNGPCKISEIDVDTWSCSGTPADCVVMGLLGGLPEISITEDLPGSPPDMVLSGINRGANVGTDIIYSGTAAAARQGSLCGIPSVALSLVELAGKTDPAVHGTDPDWHWDGAVSFIAARLEEIRAYWKPGVFVNVNFPNIPRGPRALVPAFPSLRYYTDRIEVYDAPGGDRYCFTRAGQVASKEEAGSDWDEVMKHNAAMSAVLVYPVSLEGEKR
jgi:5'-nucleotidase